MKNVDILVLSDTIKKVANLGSNKYKLSLMINEEIIDSRANKIRSTLVKPSEYADYESAARALVLEYGVKNDDGNLILYSEPNGNGEIITDPNANGYPFIPSDAVVEFDIKIKELNDQYKDMLDEFQEETAKYNKLLEEEADDISFVKFDSDLLPELDYKYIKILKPLLK